MARLKTLTETWEEYKGWAFLAFIGYCAWTLRKLFSGVGDGLGAVVEGATVNIRQAAADKAERVRVMAAVPSLKKTGVSDASLAQWRADAASLAGYFHTDGVSVVSVLPGLANVQAAFSMLKNDYSRLSLFENQPFHKNPTTGKYEKQKKETPDSVKRGVDWRVLIGPYKDITGNDLKADIRKYVKDVRMTPYLLWIL